MAELRLLTARQLRQVYRERVRSDFPPSERRPLASMERLRAAVDRDLDLAVLLGLEMTVEMLRHQGRRVARDSLEAIESLRAGCAQ